MGYIEKTYGRSEKFLEFKVCFYDTLVVASRIQKRVRGGQVRKEMCGTGALVLSPRACGCRW